MASGRSSPSPSPPSGSPPPPSAAQQQSKPAWQKTFEKLRKSLVFDLVVVRFLKGLGLGYGLVVLGSILRELLRGRGINLRDKELWTSEAAKTSALFFGCSRTVLRGCLVASGVLDGSCEAPRAASFLSGALAGLPFFLVTDNNNSQSAIALYILIRAFQLLVQSVWKMYNLPEIQNMDAIIFISSCTEIMHAWFYHQHTIPDVYARWITKMAKMDPTMLKLLKGMKEEKLQYGKRSDFLMEWCKKHGLEPTTADFLTRPVPCNVVHPTDGHACWKNSLRRSYNGVVPSLAIYTPVHLLPVLVLKPRSFIEAPFQTISKISKKILQSTTFLSAFIGMCWGGVCLVRNSPFADRREYFGPFLGCFLCGFSIFLECKSRRMELALKVLADALTSMWRRGEGAGVVRSIPGSDVGFFSLALGVIAAYYHLDRDIMRPSVRGIYGSFFE